MIAFEHFKSGLGVLGLATSSTSSHSRTNLRLPCSNNSYVVEDLVNRSKFYVGTRNKTYSQIIRFHRVQEQGISH
jgi:hypothetical protein